MSVYQFCRFMFKGVLYHSKLYSKVVKRNSFTVQYRNGAGELAYAQIIEGLRVILEESVHHLLIVDKLLVIHHNLRGATHIKVIGKDIMPRHLIPLQQITRLCVHMDFNDVDVAFISLLPNVLRVS